MSRQPPAGKLAGRVSLPVEDSRTDQQLVAALNAGDTSGFDALYHRYRDCVVRLARRFTGSDDDALDVLQETFAYVFGKFPGFSLSAKMTTFLYPVVRNLSIAARKKSARHRGADPNMEPLIAPAAPAGGRAELALVMQALPEGQREAVLLRFVDGLSLQEIASALGIPEGTVKSRLHHALNALRADPRVRSYFDEEVTDRGFCE